MYPDGLWKVILNNLKIKQLKKLTFIKLYHKLRRLFVMVSNMNKTADKVKYFKGYNELTTKIKRPDWEVYKVREW